MFIDLLDFKTVFRSNRRDNICATSMFRTIRILCGTPMYFGVSHHSSLITPWIPKCIHELIIPSPLKSLHDFLKVKNANLCVMLTICAILQNDLILFIYFHLLLMKRCSFIIHIWLCKSAFKTKFMYAKHYKCDV